MKNEKERVINQLNKCTNDQLEYLKVLEANNDIISNYMLTYFPELHDKTKELDKNKCAETIIKVSKRVNDNMWFDDVESILPRLGNVGSKYIKSNLDGILKHISDNKDSIKDTKYRYIQKRIIKINSNKKDSVVISEYLKLVKKYIKVVDEIDELSKYIRRMFLMTTLNVLIEYSFDTLLYLVTSAKYIDLKAKIYEPLENNIKIDEDVISTIKKMKIIFKNNSEYNKLIEYINLYNKNMDKQDNEVVISKKIKNVPTKNNREDRIREYNKNKNEINYLDSEVPLTSMQIKESITYVNEAVDLSEGDFDIETLIELLPWDKFDNDIVMLNDVIDRLKCHNINSNTNKLLIVLNNMLKENLLKKKIKRNAR